MRVTEAGPDGDHGAGVEPAEQVRDDRGTVSGEAIQQFAPGANGGLAGDGEQAGQHGELGEGVRQPGGAALSRDEGAQGLLPATARDERVPALGAAGRDAAGL